MARPRSSKENSKVRLKGRHVFITRIDQQLFVRYKKQAEKLGCKINDLINKALEDYAILLPNVLEDDLPDPPPVEKDNQNQLNFRRPNKILLTRVDTELAETLPFDEFIVVDKKFLQ